MNVEYVRQMQALIESSVFERTGMLVRFQIGRKKKKKEKFAFESRVVVCYTPFILSTYFSIKREKGERILR